MSWLFSQALVEAYSPGIFSDGAQSAPLNVMPTRRRFWRNDKMMGFSPRFPSGRTSRRLTATLGRAVLTSFLEDFPVRTSAPPAGAQGSPASAPASGRKWRESFARYDRASSSWKTPRSLPVVGLMSSSVTWPKWGSMRNGACSVLPTPELRTKGTGFGFWPTPTQDSATERSKRYAQGGVPLTAAVFMWPTPTVHGDYNRKGASKNSGDGLATAVKLYPTPTSTNTKAIHMRGKDKGKTRGARSYFPTPTANCSTGAGTSGRDGGMNLQTAVKMLPTPAARDFRSPNSKPYSERGGGRKGEQLPNVIGGQLNPDWVEWLMGWPIGWTDLGPLNLTAFREWQEEFRIVSGGSKASATDRSQRAR